MRFDEDGEAIVLAFRLVVFIVGVALLLSGLADFGRIGSNDVLTLLSLGPKSVLEVIVGLILTLTAINPEIIKVIIQWIIRS